MQTLLWPVINFVLLICVMVYFLKTPVKTMLQGRHTSLRDELQRVREQLTQAQSRYDQFSSKLRTIESESQTILSQSKQDAQQTRDALITHATRASQAIVQDAKQSAVSRGEGLKKEILGEFAGKVIAKAETHIRKRLTGEERARILKEFSMQMETLR